ncbi:MAG: hypothetical protein OHK0053_12490 [Microscillaceae bacterium]
MAIGLNLPAQQGSRTKGLRGKRIVQFGVGANYAQPNLDGFNAVLDLYNRSPRVGGDGGNFETAAAMIGPSAALSFYGNAGNKKLTRYLVELGYRGRFQTFTAEAGLIVPEQKVRLQMHTLSLGGGTLLFQSSVFDIGLGASIDGGFLSTAYGQGEASPENIQADLLIAGGVFLPLYLNLGKKSYWTLTLRPFYQYHLLKNDFNALNLRLNGPFLGEENPFESAPHHFGLSLEISYLIKKDGIR